MIVLRQLFKRIFGVPEDTRPKRPALWPTKEQIFHFPPFETLDPRHVIEVSAPAAAARAFEDIVPLDVVGFDTESRPTFRKGEPSTGPHVVQFATPERAWVFILQDSQCRKTASALIALETLKKVGFGLGDDLTRIRIKLGVEPMNVQDLESLYSGKGYGRGVGAKVGIALLFKKRLLKSKKLQTSNWGARRLTHNQILYAANDAYAAIRAYQALTR